MGIYTFTKEKIDFLSANKITAKVGSTIPTVGTIVTEYDTLTLTLSENKFKSVYYLSSKDKQEAFSYRNTNMVAYKKSYGPGDGSGEWKDIVINIDIPEPIKFNITDDDLARFKDSNSELYLNNNKIETPTTFKDGDYLSAIAINGKEFYQQSTDPVTSVYLVFSQFGGRDYNIPFNFVDKHNVNLDFKISKLNSVSNKLNGIYSLTTSPTEVAGNNNIYLINSDKIIDINSERFVSGSTGIEDYGKFILSLIKIPFKIPEKYILSAESIRLANKKLNTTGNKISKESIEIKYCSVSVPLDIENSNAFINTLAILRLPRVEAINIDINYVFGYTLDVYYVIDLYTGNVNVNIKSSKTGETIISKNCNMGLNIPYGSSYNNGVLDNANISVSGDNSLNKPFIEIVRGEAVYNFFSCPVTDFGKIEGKGFFRVVNYYLNGKIKSEHIQNLIIQLKQGVIIK